MHDSFYRAESVVTFKLFLDGYLLIYVGGERTTMDIGASIKRLRKSHGETQQQLGESVGVVQAIRGCMGI